MLIGEAVISYLMLIPMYYDFLNWFHRLLFSNMYLCLILPTFLGITIIYTGKRLGGKKESFLGYEDYGKTLSSFSNKSINASFSAPRMSKSPGTRSSVPRAGSSYNPSAPDPSEVMQTYQEGMQKQYETNQQFIQGKLSPLEYTAESSFTAGDTYLRATGNENVADGMGGVNKITGAATDVAGGFIKDDPTQVIKGVSDGAQGALQVLDAYSKMTPEQKEAFEQVLIYILFGCMFFFILFMAIGLIFFA
jgi:hypothetical protein